MELEAKNQEILERYSRVCAYIDLDAVLSNVANMKENIEDKTKMIAVIKTDGYGHGAMQIAKQLEQVDYVWGYATATAEEAFSLRSGGALKPILVLGYTFPYSYEKMITEDIRPAMFRKDQALAFHQVASKIGKVAKVHIKVDTAMSRVGIKPNEEGIAFIKEVMSYDQLEVEGIFTHFARADEIDKTSVKKQLAVYQEFLQQVDEKCPVNIPLKHCSNSAGIVELKDANMDLVRAGITLYGLWPSDEVRKDIVALRPVMSLKSHIVFLKTIEAGTPVSYGGTFVSEKTMKIATIPVGYGDGYPRGLSNKGYVLIRGKKAPIVGRVCMDQFMVDVTDFDCVELGDVVTLIGVDGTECISMEELGNISKRFNYELACDISKRVPRVFLKNGIIIATKDCYEIFE